MIRSLNALVLLTCGLASCTTNGTWTQNGPSLGGRLNAIVASPTDPNTLLVASCGGGIWRTTNNGTTWEMPYGYGLGDYSVLGLEWDRIRPGRLYASTYSDLLATTDLGENWTSLTGSGGYPAKHNPNYLFNEANPFAQLRFSPTSSVIFWAKRGYGLFYSFDGTNFAQHNPFPGGSNNHDNFIGAIGADESTGKVYFTTMNPNPFIPASLYRSTCAWTAGTPCLSWELVNTGLPSQVRICSIVYGGSANRMALLISDYTSAPNSKVFLTTDGRNWTNSAPLPMNSWATNSMISPSVNQLMVACLLPFVSNDWGGSWISLDYPSIHPDTRSFFTATYAAAGTYLWATTDGSGSSGAYHNISRWNFTPGNTPTSPMGINTNGMKTWQAYYMAVAAQPGFSRKRLFIGSLDNGLVASDDNGATWVAARTVGGCGDYISMQFAPSNPNRGYGVTCDGTVFAKTDNAFSAATVADVSWSSVTVPGGTGGSSLWNNASIAIDPTNPDRVCIARRNNMTISENGGGAWESHNLPGNAKPVSAYIAADHGVYITTLDSGIFKTTDNGTNWTPFGLNDGSFRVVSKIIHTSAGGAGGTYYAATSKGLFRKLPGAGFEYVDTGGDSSYVVSDVEVDPTCPSRIYIAKGYLGSLNLHRGGVLVSLDNGNTFKSITSGLTLHQSPVSDIQVDPVNPRYVYAASFGLGGWTYTWQALPDCE